MAHVISTHGIMKRTRILMRVVCLCFLIAPIAFTQQASGSRPYTLDEILALMKKQVSEGEIMKQINVSKVSFELTNENTAQLVRGDASDKLLACIKNNYAMIDTSVTLLRPVAGAVVTDEGDVSGTYNMSITDDIWVFIWPEQASRRGWPQSDDSEQGLPCEKQNGKWIVHCGYGGPPQSYDIVVYTASTAASNFISMTLQRWVKQKDYPGILQTRLPQGLKERMKVTVRKR